MSFLTESYILIWPNSWHNVLARCFLHILCWKQQEYSERKVLFFICKADQQSPHGRTVLCPVPVCELSYTIPLLLESILQSNKWYLFITNTARWALPLLLYPSSLFFTSKTIHLPMRFFQVSRALAITRTLKTGKQGAQKYLWFFFLLEMHILYKTKKSTDKELDRLFISADL